MKRTYLVGAAIAAAMVFGASANAQNLVTDGDFEGCTPVNNFNVGPSFSVATASTHNIWLDVNQWVCAAEDIITGSDGQFAQQVRLDEPTGTNNLLFQGFPMPPEIESGPDDEVLLCFDYINQNEEGQSLGAPDARIYTFGPTGTLSKFAPWNTTDQTSLTQKTLNTNQPEWVHDTLPANIDDTDAAIVVAFRFGYQGAAPYPSGDVHGVDNVELVTLPFSNLDIDPDTLNPKSQGNFVTAYISEFSGCFDVETINPNSLELTQINGNTLSSPLPVVQSDLQDGVLMVKFSRPALIQALIDEGMPFGPVTLTVEGAGVMEDTISVLNKYPN